MNKKIFMIMIILLFICSLSFVSANDNKDTVLSVSDSDDMLCISNNNISYQTNNEDIIGNNVNSDNILSDSKIATKLHVTPTKEGIIEDDSVVLNITLTDVDDNPIKYANLKFYINDILNGNLDINDGACQYTLKESSGFYYFRTVLEEDKLYSGSESNLVEIIFANDNTMSDLAVRMILADGELNLTKDYVGYGSNSVIRRDVENNQILVQYDNLNVGIPVSGTFTINGNGHKIDASKEDYLSRCFFIVDGGTFTLNDLILSNGYNLITSNYLFTYKNHAKINLNNVTLKDSYSGSPFFGLAQWADYSELTLNVKNSKFLNNDLYIDDNSYFTIFSPDLSDSNIENSVFINNTNVFYVSSWDDVNIHNNLFIDNKQVFALKYFPMWEKGIVADNYFGTNDTSEINEILPENTVDIEYTKGTQTYLSIDGNPTFCEDDVQDFDIYFTGNVPSYETVISYTSDYSTINTTAINISSNKTTVRVSPKGYGLETLIVEPNLYVLPINITKSTKLNYNVTVDAPETQYSIPFIITVNVYGEDNNPVTTTANITIDGTTKTINITNGVGTLQVNDLIPGKYDITTKIISNMNNYRNTTIYSSTNITRASTVIALSCNTTESLAREKVTFTIKTKNVIGNNISSIVYLVEDGAEVGSTTTDSNGNAIYYYAPEAGNHIYSVRTHDDEYWKSAESNSVDLHVVSKIPTKLTISSDAELIIDANQKANINSRLTDMDDNPINGVKVNLVANDVIVDTKTTDRNGECKFEFSNTSGFYMIKTVYDGNLTYYDNSSDVLSLTISTGGSFFDLSILINITEENGVLTLIRNFTFDEELDHNLINGIPINKNIVINGGGYTVDALSKSKIFDIDAQSVALNNLNLINGFSHSNGGAILFSGESLNIFNSTFRNNIINLSKKVDDNARLGGGVIYSEGILNIVDSTFENNGILFYKNMSSDSIYYCGGGDIFTTNDLSINNSVFDSSMTKGYKINNDTSDPRFYGASLFIHGGTTEIRNSTFKNGSSYQSAVFYNNPNGNCSIYDSLFVNNSACYGGALSLLSKNGNIINTTFENNCAQNDVGALIFQANYGYITESKFINNSALQAGAINIYYTQSCIVEKSFFINNKASNGSSVFYSPESNLIFRYNIVVNNTADDASGAYHYNPFDDEDTENLNYDYWGNNTPFDGNIFNDRVNKTFEYITLEIIGENVTYNTIPTTYTIKFNGTDADKLPDFETLIDVLAKSNVKLDKTSIVINGSGAKVILTSDAVQNVTLVVGPEYNMLACFNITVKQLIKKNYTSNITISGDVYGNMQQAAIDIFDENRNQNGINGSLTYTFNGKIANATVENGKAIIQLGRNDAGEYGIDFVFNSTDLFYNNLTGNKSFSVSKANMTFTLDVNNTIYGENVIITATPQRGVTGNFTFYIENLLNTRVPISVGKASYTLKNIGAGNYTVIATYDSKNYNSKTLSRNFTVSKASSKVKISIDDVTYGDEIIAYITGENIVGNVTVTVNNKNYSVKIIKNSGNVTIDKLNAGKYVAHVVCGENSNITGNKDSTQFNVFKASSNMTVDIGESILGHKTTISVKFSDGVEGNVIISVDGIANKLPIKNGIATLDLTDLTEGIHNVSVNYSGNVNYNSSEFNSRFSTKTLESQINVTSDNIVYGRDLIVKANVNSDATGNVEFSVNNITKTATIKNGVAQVSFKGLNAGTYEVIAKYLGDDTYISSSNTTSVKVSKAQSYVSIDVCEIMEDENVVIKFTVPGNATGNVTVEIPGLYTSRNRTLTNGIYVWTISPLKSGTYTLNVMYNGDSNYLPSSNSTALIAKYHPDIIIEVSKSAIGQDVTVDVALPNNATGSVLITVDGIKYNKTLKNAKASVIISNITKGTHNVNVLYSGDDIYYSSSNSTSFVPKQLISNIHLLASDVKFGEDLIVRAVVDDDATGTVTFTVNGVNKVVQVHQGFAAASYSNLNAGSYNIKATYSGDEIYSSSTNTTKANVLKVNSSILIDVGAIREGLNVQIKISLSKSATGNITLEIPGLYSSRVRTLSNSQYIWTISPITAGLYKVNVAYDGDVNYYGSSNYTYIDYNRIRTTLDVDAILTKNNVRLIANISAEDGQLITAWVNVTVNGTKYRIPVFNGTGYLDLGKLEGGKYQFSALYTGNKVIVNSTDEGSFTVIPVVPVLNVPDLVKYYKGSERLYVYLTDNYNDPIANASVVISINGNDYERKTNANGTASIAIGLNSGEFETTVIAKEYNITSISKVTVLPTVNGTNVVKVYRNATQYYATFRDSEGNYLKEGTMVKFNINGVFYERKISGDKGMAKLNLNLGQGNYLLTAMNPVTGENGANNITIISRIIENHDITKYFRNGTQYTVKILGDDGKPVGAGETVTFNINGVMYTRTTNASGIVKLNINLNPGTYIITCEYAGCKVSNTIKVLPILTANDLVKKYGTNNQFVAKLVDGQGNSYSGQSVSFNINGVFYNRVTDNLGQARLNINLLPGQYIITSSYNAANISNKVTITP